MADFEVTPEQEASLEEYCKIWTAVAYSCDPCDGPAARDAAILAYQAVNEAPPSFFCVVDSPLSAAVLTSCLALRESDRAKKSRTKVQDIVRDYYESLYDILKPSFPTKDSGDVPYIPVKDAVKTLFEAYRDKYALDATDLTAPNVEILDPLHYLVGAMRAITHKTKKLRGPLENELVPGLRDQLSRQLYGSHEATWLGFYQWCATLNEQCAEQVKPLEGLTALSRVCGWWTPFAGTAVFQHRHTQIHYDWNRQQLSNPDGPAIEWRDGTCLWFIDGHNVDEQIVLRPHTQTAAQITNEGNVEVQRLRIERFGWAPYLDAINAKLLEKRMNPIEGTVEALYRLPASALLMCVCPSTKRVYALEVGDIAANGADITTCQQAQDWLAGGGTMRLIGAS